MNYPKLDLHGVRHHQVEQEVENFVLMHDCPMEIVTGNSDAMKNIVHEVLSRHDLKGEVPHHYNLGCLIVMEDRK